jgi:hypothetical protein
MALSEEPITRRTEATRVLVDCETFLTAASERVLTIPASRQKVLEDLAAAKELYRRAREELSRVYRERLGAWYEAKAEQQRDEAYRQVGSAYSFLASDDLDTEYQKAVARQIAALLRDDSRARLDEIAARSDDPELQRAVAKCNEGVDRAARGVINRFPAAAPLLQDEVRKARVEACEVLERKKKHPLD